MDIRSCCLETKAIQILLENTMHSCKKVAKLLGSKRGAMGKQPGVLSLIAYLTVGKQYKIVNGSV